jgi:uncharacterized protein
MTSALNRRRFVGGLAAGATALARPAWGHAAPARRLHWRELLPADWDAFSYFHRFRTLFPNVDQIDDSDPVVAAMMQRMREFGHDAPSVASLQGQWVAVPGFLAPLAQSPQGEVTEFLLVPYQGGCIHKPPPPANQAVHVRPQTPVSASDAAQAVWVSGLLDVQRTRTPLGTAAYQVQAAAISRVDWTTDAGFLMNYRNR